jgi:hypothetical protein
MGQTPDRFPGEREEEGIKFDEGSVHPTLTGEVRYVAGVGFRFFEEGFEKGLGGAEAALHPASFTAGLGHGQDEIFGVVTGLPTTPVRVAGLHILEDAVGEAQSGFSYTFNAYEMTADGFKWRIKMNEDFFWPDPAGVTLKIHYLWSET